MNPAVRSTATRLSAWAPPLYPTGADCADRMSPNDKPVFLGGFAASFRFLPAHLLELLLWVIPLPPFPEVTLKRLTPRSGSHRRIKVWRCYRTKHSVLRSEFWEYPSNNSKGMVLFGSDCPWGGNGLWLCASHSRYLSTACQHLVILVEQTLLVLSNGVWNQWEPFPQFQSYVNEYAKNHRIKVLLPVKTPGSIHFIKKNFKYVVNGSFILFSLFSLPYPSLMLEDIDAESAWMYCSVRGDRE